MKALYKILSLVAFAGLFASCNEDPVYYQPLGQGQEDNLHVTADNKEVKLLKENETQDAITFTWDKVVSSLSPDGDVTYSIRIYNADNVTETTKFYNVGTDTQKTFSVYELNSIIGRWVPAGAICNLAAQVVAKMANNSHYVLPQKSVCSFTAIGYERFPAILYMHILNHDTYDEEKVVPLTQTSLGSGIYMLNETLLDPAYYYFGTTDATSEEVGPSYVADNRTLDYAGQAITLNMGEVAPEQYIEFTEDDVEKYTMADMTIVVDLNDPDEENGVNGLDVRYANIVSIPSGKLYIVGDACEIGWHPGVSQAEFTNPDPRSPWLYEWTGNFEYKADQENAFKLVTSEDYNKNGFFAATAGADPQKDYTLLPMRDQGNGGDLKWKITEDVKGLYTVTVSLDLNDMWIKLEPADETAEE